MENIKTFLSHIADGFYSEKQIPYFPGLYHGKIGVAVFLCHYSRWSQQEKYNDFAFDLIEEAQRQMKGKSPVNYPYGLSGMGTGIAYMVQNKYFNANPDEILEDFDNILSKHMSTFIDLSSFKQTIGIGRYFSSRIKDSGKQDKIKEIIEKVVLLIELQLTRTPYCFPYALDLLYDLRGISEKAYKVFEENMKLFDSHYIKDDPWGWFNFFYKTQVLFSEKLVEVNRNIIANSLFEAQAERIRRDIVTGKEVETSMVQRAIDQAQVKGDAGLLTGLSGLGLSLICLSDKSHLTWLGLI
ncbi:MULTISPECIES: lanthionine synthetase LanC family protein [Proteiniphilum]|uniref:lanthionine synthetase LanC family protein n=1 Tax=Proteiniphilum TaxID=294702 RepID=UPI0003632420|nr:MULTISPECIES: lanthionine synthetase LanC family protein [Proteiniphilum]